MSLFHFKQFVINQEKCPMKINTDGVLLGALINIDHAKSICDIGTGTGVIALMLAQRNHEAIVDALDIDYRAIDTASINFEKSLFHDRIHAHHHSFVEYFEMHPDKKYDLIVSNPPFFLNSLRSPEEKKNLAKHTDERFFIELLRVASMHLKENGTLDIIVPLEISLLLQHLAVDYHLFYSNCIEIRSYADKSSFRHILRFQKQKPLHKTVEDFVIYEREGEHSIQYKNALKDFFTIY